MVGRPGRLPRRRVAVVLRRCVIGGVRGRVHGRVPRPRWHLFGLVDLASAMQSGVSRLETGWRQQQENAGGGIGDSNGTRLCRGGGAGCASNRPRGWPNRRMQRHNERHQEVLLNTNGERLKRRPGRPSATVRRVAPVTTASRHGPMSRFPGNIDSSELLAGVPALPGGCQR